MPAPNESAPETREKVSSNAFYKQLFETMRNSTSAIHWGDRGRTFNNGSVFFINTGEGLFAVTALHVYQGYVEAATRKGATYCQIDNLRFDPIKRLASQQGNVDLATFYITPDELAKLGKLTMPWPPVIPSKGNSVMVSGVPGSARSNPMPARVNFSCYIAMFAVDNISEASISMMKGPDHELVDVVGKGLPPCGFNVGGMSGGPIATLQKTPAGLITWSLSGVIYEGHQSFDIIRGLRADLIKPDGTLSDSDFM